MVQLPIPDALIPDLQSVDTLMLERLRSRSALIGAAGRHILSSGGKRIRPALTLLSCQLGDYRLTNVIHAATAVEMIHAATLVHDDLIDDAERRRNKVTVHTRWDNGVALMVGDYLFALASVEMSLAPDPRIIAYFSQAVMTICEGELSPVMTLTPLEQALEQYRFKTGAKTGALFEAGCKAGMAAGNGTPEQIAAMGAFGYSLGMAFQIVDDILDYVGDEQTLGKPAGSDLRHGTLTLPLIFAAATPGGADLADVADADQLDDAQVAEILAEVKRLGGVEQASAEAERYARQALEQLTIFPASPARAALEEIAHFALSRRG